MALRRSALSLVPRLAACKSELLAPLQKGSDGMPQMTLGHNNPEEDRSFHRAFASEVAAVKPSASLPPCDLLSRSPTHHILYDEHSHKRYPPSSEDHKTGVYLVTAGGRFMYATAARLLALKFILSMTAAADTLAMASLEVDLSSLNEGDTVTVKWRGKPVFIRHRTEAEIEEARATPMSDLRDAQTDDERTVDPKYLVVVGVCTHLGCVPIAGAGDYNGWFCPCHGSHYDISGRIRKGPAPYNLEVPEYKFLGDGKAIIG